MGSGGAGRARYRRGRAPGPSTGAPRLGSRAVFRTPAVGLLLLPTVLAFFASGFREPPRLVAGTAVWLLVAALAVAAPAPLPRRRAARLALGGLAALLTLTLASLAWAPLLGAAYGDAQRLALYLGVLVAGGALLCAAAGLVVLVLARPSRAQLGSAALAAAAAAVAGVPAASLEGVAEPARASDAQGAVLLAVLAVAGAAAAMAQLRLAGAVPGPLPRPVRRALAGA